MAGRVPSHSAVDDVVSERLRLGQQRYTTGRRRLVKSLMNATRPLTIPELIMAHPRLKQSSAYRNLQILEQVGVVHRIVTSGEHARFELTEDLVGHHHHLVCVKCGRVDDFTVSPQLEHQLEAALTKSARENRFEPTSHRLDLIGACQACTR
jgi:Fe2+ or Zn2+ uptake regulation protein